MINYWIGNYGDKKNTHYFWLYFKKKPGKKLSITFEQECLLAVPVKLLVKRFLYNENFARFSLGTVFTIDPKDRINYLKYWLTRIVCVGFWLQLDR